MKNLIKFEFRKVLRSKYMYIILGIGVLFLAEMSVINLGEDNYFEYTVMSVTMMVGMFMVMFNVLKSFYGAN